MFDLEYEISFCVLETFNLKSPFSVARLSLNPLVMFVIQVQSLGKRLNFSFRVYLRNGKNKKDQPSIKYCAKLKPVAMDMI